MAAGCRPIPDSRPSLTAVRGPGSVAWARLDAWLQVHAPRQCTALLPALTVARVSVCQVCAVPSAARSVWPISWVPALAFLTRKWWFLHSAFAFPVLSSLGSEEGGGGLLKSGARSLQTLLLRAGDSVSEGGLCHVPEGSSLPGAGALAGQAPARESALSGVKSVELVVLGSNLAVQWWPETLRTGPDTGSLHWKAKQCWRWERPSAGGLQRRAPSWLGRVGSAPWFPPRGAFRWFVPCTWMLVTVDFSVFLKTFDCPLGSGAGAGHCGGHVGSADLCVNGGSVSPPTLG